MAKHLMRWKETPMSEVSLAPGTVILVVDDDPLCCRMIKHMLEPDDVLVLEAANMEEALRLLESNTAVQVDLILLDRSLPDGDGLMLIPKVRAMAGCNDVPIIIQSGRFAEDEVQEGLKFGAFHYLSKPYRRDALRAFVRVAVRNFRDRRHLLSQLQSSEDGLAFLSAAEFEIRTTGDAKVLIPYLARFFPNAETAALGISELVFNAIEHGNLEIGYDLKCELLTSGAMKREVERRLASPEFRKRRVKVRMEKLDDRVELNIIDDGRGFDWRSYLELDGQRLFDLHGRGIALVRQFCFSGVEYLGAGNQVRCWCDA